MLSKFIRSAFRAGSLAGVRVRQSGHAPSGVVVACYFRSHARAGAFAARWASRLGHSVVVRSAWRPGLWAVSLPVAGAVPFMGPCVWPVTGVRSVGAVIGAASRALL